jgi:hypothetical protein
MASTLLSARRRVIVLDGATWKGRQGVVVGKPVMDDRWWERWCRGAVPEVSWKSLSGRVWVKESWACKLARWVGVVSASRRCVQVLVFVRIRCSWSKWRLRDCPWSYHHGRRRYKRASIRSSICLDERIKFKYEGAVNQWRGVSSMRTCLYMRLEWMV